MDQAPAINKTCLACNNSCKQSSKANIVCCPHRSGRKTLLCGHAAVSKGDGKMAYCSFKAKIVSVAACSGCLMYSINTQ